MSLPREWCIQDSRGSMHRLSGPTSTFSSSTAEHDAAFLRTQALLDMDTTNADCLLVSDTAGSLYSVHSAPPVPLTELGIIKNENGLGYDLGMDSPRRPASLAIDPQYLPLSKHQGVTGGGGGGGGGSMHHQQQQSSELDDEDNENLLTVSSLTARPLIAKSRELRSNKLAERKKNMVQSSAGPPDGGYGWFVVFGAFFVQFWVAGLVKSYGVLFVEIMETFPSSTAAVASWIPAILSALCLALAPLSSALCQRFSCRTVVFIGGLFCTCGLTLSYFATSLYHLLFTFGILTGIGGGLSTTPGIVIVSRYFDKHRALANGICVSGTAAGSFIFPMLIEHLVYNFGFHGTILILGGCMLHVCLSATLYRPLELSPDTSTVKSSDGAKSAISNGPMTNSTYLASTDEPPNSKRFIEHLFMEESKNRINDMYTNGFVNGSEKILDTDDEDKDTIGETTFMKPMKSIRSSSFLHSVEDLSTDSTCVYKNRSGYDSNRGSRRRNKNAFSTDEFLCKIPPHRSEQLTIPATTNRGLSKSMIIPTPISDFSEIDEEAGVVGKKTCCQRIQQYLDVTLVRDTTFILMTLSVTLMSTGCPYMLYYLPAFVISTNHTKSEAGYLVAISAALDLIGRLGFGYLSDLQLFDRKKAYNVCILGAGIAVLIIPQAESWYLLCFASGLYGFCLGSWYLLIPVLLADLFGTERISSSYGLVRMFQSVGAISVPPLAGYLTDVFGGYEIIFYCMGSCMVLGSIPMLVSVICSDPEETTEDCETSAVS